MRERENFMSINFHRLSKNTIMTRQKLMVRETKSKLTMMATADMTKPLILTQKT